MKYRFNWNAPIVVSSHDANVIYHAGNILMRSRDRGRSWEEASPDLTRDEDDKQGPGGGPITNEGAGGEIYNTIIYVSESPHDPGTIWTGSDDGLVHVTQDGGVTWNNVTPDGIGEAMINAIEVSPHEPAAAYMAVTGYKFNDFTPHVFKTTDYGRNWERVVDGFAEEAFVRVVREDPVRRGLLYAGTELGMYVSWDDGGHWQSLHLNMPLTPITDLIVQQRENDLVAATQGRGFWILDNLGPLQQMDESIADSRLHLLEPGHAYRTSGGGFGPGGGVSVGANPPAGAIIDFYVGEAGDSTPVQVEILEGPDVIRTYSSTWKEGDTGSKLTAKHGMNRMAWNARHEAVPNVPGLYVFGSLRGRKVVPGTYAVRLTVGDETRTEPVEVLPDPRQTR